MIRNLITALPQNLLRAMNQRQAMQNSSSISIIKSAAQGREQNNKVLKLALSFYALSHEGALDFGKLAVDKFKTKKDPADIESNARM